MDTLPNVESRRYQDKLPFAIRNFLMANRLERLSSSANAAVYWRQGRRTSKNPKALA